MGRRLLEFFKSIGVGLWIAFAFIFAVVVGGLRLFYRGKEQGEAEASAQADKDAVQEAAERGDDAAVLKLWRKARRKDQ